MGICSSCDSTAVATAKIISLDGRLQEFPYPVKVSFALQDNPACFICNSDEMGFNGVVSAVRSDEELQLGQLYFALPISRLRQRLPAKEMAAMAVIASSALTKSCGGGCSEKCRYCRVVFTGEYGSSNKLQWKKGVGGGASESGRRSRRRRSASTGGSTGSFMSTLSSIPE